MTTATKYGEYTVPIRNSHFGDYCDIRLDGLILVMYRGNHGWKAASGRLQFARLPGQIYTKEVDKIIEFGVREIVAVDLKSGQWQTIWASAEKEISHP